jgi:hypothetical protein
MLPSRPMLACMEPNSDPAALVKVAIGQALAIAEPAERARAVSRIFDEAASADLKAAREADIRELRKTMTLAQISELTGLSIGRVDQIAKGRVTGRRAPRPV